MLELMGSRGVKKAKNRYYFLSNFLKLKILFSCILKNKNSTALKLVIYKNGG